MKKSVIAAIAALACTATPALAADWRPLGTLTSGVEIYVDVDASQPYADGTIDLWTQSVYPRPQRDGTKFSITQSLVDCNDMTDATLKISSYDSRRNLIDTFNYRNDVEWDGLSPNSLYGEFVRKLCDAKFGGRY